MGIDSKRFIGKSHEPFICAVCLDVAEDPIMTPCEHIFCEACFTPGRCPSCRGQVQYFTGINRVLKQVYGALKMRCMSTACSHRCRLENYKSHDNSCPKRKCRTCGYVIGYNHNCVAVCKSKIRQLQRQVAQLTRERDNKNAESSRPKTPMAK